MNKSNCVIPYEITFYIPGDNYDFGDKVLEDGSIPATFVGSKDSSTKKTNAKLSLVNNNWGALNKDGVVKEITVLNTGFTISLSPNNIKIRYYYNNEVSVLVTSDSLIEALGPGTKLQLKLQLDEFFNLILSNGGNLVSGKIPGQYCLTMLDGSKGRIIQLHLESNQDEALAKSKEAGKAMRGRLSSKWIPGHLYAMRNGKHVLYLGDLKDLVVSGYGRGSYLNYVVQDSFIGKSYYYQGVSKINSGRLMIMLESESTRDYVENNLKGKELINALLNDILFNSEFRCSLILRDSSAPIWTGADMGEYLSYGDSSEKINEIIKDHCRSILKKNTVKDLDKVTDEVKNCFIYAPEVLRNDQEYRKSFIDQEKAKFLERVQSNMYYSFREVRDRKNITKEQFLSSFQYYTKNILQPEYDVVGYTQEEKDKIIDAGLELARNYVR